MALVYNDGAMAASRVDTPATVTAATAPSEVRTAVDELDGRLLAARSDVDTANAGLSDVDRRIAALRATLLLHQSTVEELKGKVTQQAVSTYLRGRAANATTATADGDASEAAANRAALDAVTEDVRGAATALTSTKDTLTTLVSDLQAAEQQRTVAVALLDQRTALLDRQRMEQQRLVDQIEQALEDTLAKAASITSSGEPLAQQIDNQLADAKARAEKAQTVAKAQALRASPSSATGTLATVRGIQVDASLARSLDAMLAAAEADGVSLGGSGWRDQNEQIQRRRENCGSSDYAIWEMPAEQCSPVTARPGRSLHERGLAIDFTTNRYVISRSSAGFKWLAANAANYGFYNLPSEPWHWSIDAN
jgi:LAS superfamily LD-carboxypeptidase LdcB